MPDSANWVWAIDPATGEYAWMNGGPDFSSPTPYFNQATGKWETSGANKQTGPVPGTDAPADLSSATPGQVAGVFNAPQYSGPLAAPLTTNQLTDIGRSAALNPGQPIIQSQDLLKTMALGINPTGGTSLSEGVNKFTLPGEANRNETLGTSYGSALAAPSFDTTTMFKAGGDLFKNQLADTIAKTKEEYSGLGLGPGSTDRAAGITREAGNATNQFVVNQEQIAQKSFEDAQNRKLGAVSLAPTVSSVMSQPYDRYYKSSTDTANRAISTLPSQIQAFQLPQQQLANDYALNEQARSAADTEAQRASGEFARTQNMGLNELLSILSGSPLNNTVVGPSPLAEIGGLLGGAGSAAGGMAKLAPMMKALKG